MPITSGGRSISGCPPKAVSCGDETDTKETLIIPQHEIDNLTMVTNTAEHLAAEGDLAAGYGALLSGGQRAQESQDQGAEWGAELVQRWRAACENYVEAYGLSMREGDGRG